MHELKMYLCDKIHYSTGSYLFKINKGNTRAMGEIRSKLIDKDTRTVSMMFLWVFD